MPTMHFSRGTRSCLLQLSVASALLSPTLWKCLGTEENVFSWQLFRDDLLQKCQFSNQNLWLCAVAIKEEKKEENLLFMFLYNLYITFTIYGTFTIEQVTHDAMCAPPYSCKFWTVWTASCQTRGPFTTSSYSNYAQTQRRRQQNPWIGSIYSFIFAQIKQ